MSLRTVLVASLLAVATSFGKKQNKQKDGAAALRDELDSETQKVQQDTMGGARDYELENLARHRAGELSDAELGLENMKHAMNDPSAMAEVADLMKDPENVAKVQKMMADPQFQAQARQAMAGMPDLGKMMNDPEMMAKVQGMMQDPAMMAKAQAMAKAMYGGGMAGGGMGGMGSMAGSGMDSAAAELARLRRENAALKGQMGAL